MGGGSAPLLRRSAVVAPLAIALAASCGPVAGPPPSATPVNACPPDSCDAYRLLQPASLAPATCGVGQCISNTTIDFTLVVSIPTNATWNADLGANGANGFSQVPGGMTIAIPHFGLSSGESPGETHSCPGAPSLSCAQVPDAANQEGTLSVDVTTELCAGRPVDTGGAVLPANVEFWPRWAASSTAKVTVPASAVGLPLPTVAAQTVVNEGGGSGPSQTPATRWGAVLGAGIYEEDIVPLDANYPPKIFNLPFSGGFQFVTASADPGQCSPPSAPPFTTTFNVTPGTGSLDGFSVYLRDATTLRRISSLATLSADAGGPVTILTSGELGATGDLPSGSELVVAPPDGVPVPTYADLIAPVATLADVSFPPLPTPYTVSGVVLDANGIGIDADLVIDSTAPTSSTGGIVICSDADCTSPASGSTQRPLSYSTTAHASSENGYSVVLPPGDYDVFIVPAVGVQAGATSVPLGVQFFPGASPVAEAKTLQAAALATISGRAVLADGRPLAGAIVEAHAAATLAMAVDPTNPMSTDPRRWPRAAGGVTDDDGAFSFTADPGTYDLIVRPQDGTGFPWLTVTSRVVEAGATLSFSSLGSLVVPAPILIDLTLQDRDGYALTGAIVRAYAPITTFTPPIAGAPQPEVELGAWLTDGAGHFSMYVAPPE